VARHVRATFTKGAKLPDMPKWGWVLILVFIAIVIAAVLPSPASWALAGIVLIIAVVIAVQAAQGSRAR
jgi:hypothetical protein